MDESATGLAVAAPAYAAAPLSSDTKMFRFPSKTSALRFLREAAIPVGTIVDVGVSEETLELRKAFPNLRHVLFEPVSELHAAIRRNYAGMDYLLVPAAASDRDGEGRLRKMTVDGKNISHSTLVEGTSDEQLEPVATMRLDRFLNNRMTPNPIC
jgi:FkbM family methyltransferase